MRGALRFILILSVGLNLVLAGGFLRGFHHRSSLGPAVSASVSTSRARAADRSPPAEPAVTFVTNRFDWRQLESRDYEQFIANLRAVGCPEQTLRDIISADIKKLYAQKCASVPLQVGFWTGGARRAAAVKQQKETQRALEDEKQALFQRLLGPDYDLELISEDDDLDVQALARFLMGPVPERSYLKAMALMKQWDEDASEIRAQAAGVMFAEDTARLRGVRERALQQLRNLLSPEQFDEFAQHMAIVALNDDALHEMHLGADTLRRVARVYLDLHGPFDNGPIGEMFSGDNGTKASQEALFQDRLKELLGERYGEYQRASDPAFQALQAVVQQHKLPKETAVKVYEIKQLLESESLRVRTEGSFEPGALESQLSALQDTAVAGVRQVLGEQAYQTWLRQGSSAWLTNMSSP